MTVTHTLDVAPLLVCPQSLAEELLNSVHHARGIRDQLKPSAGRIAATLRAFNDHTDAVEATLRERGYDVGDVEEMRNAMWHTSGAQQLLYLLWEIEDMMGDLAEDRWTKKDTQEAVESEVDTILAEERG